MTNHNPSPIVWCIVKCHQCSYIFSVKNITNTRMCGKAQPNGHLGWDQNSGSNFTVYRKIHFQESPFITGYIEIWASKKVDFWLGQKRSIFCHLWIKVHQIRYSCARVIGLPVLGSETVVLWQDWSQAGLGLGLILLVLQLWSWSYIFGLA